VLLMFGTGYGLADELISAATLHLAPIRPHAYNHLAVRSAVAVVVDRLFGDGGV
jgi:tRNA (guanine37-N1)-methyltransferase